LSGGTIKNYYATVKLFYDANAINLNWKWIYKGLPASAHVANDRAPTLEEIRKLIAYPDRRVKIIICIMVSSGVRIGAFAYLKYKHFTPIENKKTGQVIAVKIKVYDGLPDPYFSFVTPEAWQAIQEYMDFRAMHGEKIIGESWLLRDKFDTTDKNGAKRSLATHPKKLSVAGIKKILIRAMKSQGIRQSLEQGAKRYEFKLAHGYRKYFKTTVEHAGMLPINIEVLMDHKTGISASYYRPTEQALLEDYLKVVDSLSVSKDQRIANQLQKQVTELTEKSEETNYVIIGKLAEKDKELQQMQKKLEEMQAREEQRTKEMADLSKGLNELYLEKFGEAFK
jgi:integrase